MVDWKGSKKNEFVCGEMSVQKGVLDIFLCIFYIKVSIFMK